MFYNEALSWIDNIERAGSDYGLERERELLTLLGNPEKQLKIVHIAGTNGKGSVCAYLTTICVAACLKTGTYNSPSVYDYNERFLINGEPIPGGMVAKYMTVLREKIEEEQRRREEKEIAQKFQPTAFEIETAMMLLCFAEEKCDIVIMETGLGGRWDATNAVENKEVAVITTIGLDHCALLGDTLGKIAAEKADIIRKNAVTHLQPFEVMKVLQDKVSLSGGELFVADEPALVAADIEGQVFDYKDERYTIPMLGRHQLTNAAIAIETANELIRRGWNISEDDVRFGLANTVWHVRFEILSNYTNYTKTYIPTYKLLVLDGGHNPQGAEVLADCVRDYFPGMRLHFVVGVLADKDYVGILKQLLPLANGGITTVTPPSPRALSAEDLACEVEKLGGKAETSESIPLAVQKALGEYNDAVVLCGSLTLFKALGKKL